MPSPSRPTYQAIVSEALRATAASSGWLLQVGDRHLRVLAVAGRAAATTEVGAVVPRVGARAYVSSSARPTAMRPHPNDPDAAGTAGLDSAVLSVLVVPCGDDEPVGVIELANKTTAESFTFEDMDRVSSLGVVASAALSEVQPHLPQTVPPRELMATLEQIAATSPDRYLHLAEVVRGIAERPR